MAAWDTLHPALFRQQDVDTFIKMKSGAIFKGFSCNGVDRRKR
jgi:hypothetical protein